MGSFKPYWFLTYGLYYVEIEWKKEGEMMLPYVKDRLLGLEGINQDDASRADPIKDHVWYKDAAKWCSDFRQDPLSKEHDNDKLLLKWESRPLQNIRTLEFIEGKPLLSIGYNPLSVLYNDNWDFLKAVVEYGQQFWPGKSLGHLVDLNNTYPNN